MRTIIRLLSAVIAGLLVLAGASVAGAKTVWLCRPGVLPDPCTPGLSTTRYSTAATPLGVEHPSRVRQPKIDCFYVYPTVSDQQTPLANLHIDPVERSIALYQTARYSQYCRVFAPMYRELTLAVLSGAAKLTSAQARVPLADVRHAFHAYLTRYNHGRGYVLIGHSQGAFLLRRLIALDIDSKAAARRQLVSAILLGGDVVVKSGKGVGGDFKHVRACRSARQLGCVVAFSTFDTPVLPNSKFGLAPAAGESILCTDPAALGGGSGVLDSILPSRPFAPASTLALGIKLLGVPMPTPPTVWVSVPGAYRGSCSSANGANVLQITPLGGAPSPHPSPDGTWGLHLMDANVALGNLIEMVRTEAVVYARRRG